MQTKQLTESAILSAVLIMLSAVFLGTGIGYGFYLDNVVPILIGLIYMRCGLKWSGLAALNSIVITFFVLGRIGGSIWMIQGVLIGLITGHVIMKGRAVLDDLMMASVVGCIIMIVIDCFFSGILGVSILEQISLQELGLPVDFISPKLQEVALYLGVAALPIGTVIITYIGLLILGNRLRLLGKGGHKKYQVIRGFMKYKPYMYLTDKISIIAVIYLGACAVCQPILTGTYLRAFCMASQYIVLYFLLSDMLSIIDQVIYILTRSALLVSFVGLILLMMLIQHFYVMAVALIIIGMGLEQLTKIKKVRQIALDELLKKEVIELRWSKS